MARVTAKLVYERQPCLLSDKELADRVFPDQAARIDQGNDEVELELNQGTLTTVTTAHQVTVVNNQTFLFVDFSPYLDSLAQIPSQQKEPHSLIKENESEKEKYHQALPGRITEADANLRSAATELYHPRVTGMLLNLTDREYN